VGRAASGAYASTSPEGVSYAPANFALYRETLAAVPTALQLPGPPFLYATAPFVAFKSTAIGAGMLGTFSYDTHPPNTELSLSQ